MNVKKMTLCAFSILALFIGINISGDISKASAFCYCPGPCQTDCEYDPLFSSKQCGQLYSSAVLNDVSGNGVSIATPCGIESTGFLCLTVSGLCGGNSYSNGAC